TSMYARAGGHSTCRRCAPRSPTPRPTTEGIEMATLNTESNLPAPDDFYERLIATHRGLSDEESALVNAKLVLLLANHIGDPGVPEAIAFGRRLFFEPRFSPSGYISCVACHQPDRGFTDALPRARGLAPVERNAIALQNLRLQRWYGWGGSSDSLWMASLRPI